MKTQEQTKNQEQMIYEIQINAKRVKGEKNGKKFDFLSYEGYDKNGNKCRFKFVNGIENLPDEEGEYIIKVDKRFINKDKQSRYNNYWIRQITSCEKFDGYYENDEDLPF